MRARKLLHWAVPALIVALVAGHALVAWGLWDRLSLPAWVLVGIGIVIGVKIAWIAWRSHARRGINGPGD